VKKVIFLLLIFNVLSLFAQGQAFTKHPVTKEEYANAIEKNNKSILRIDCEKLVQAIQDAWPELKIRDKYDLADYIRSLVEITGPTGPAKFSRVFKNGTVDFNWTRNIKEGEILLFDNNRAEFMFSLSCGNMTFGVPVSNVFKKTERQKNLPVEEKSLEELKIEFNYYNNSKNNYSSVTNPEKSSSLSLGTVLVIGGVTAVVVAILIKILAPHHDMESPATPIINISSGGTIGAN
jgi:hypothetical protein